MTSCTSGVATKAASSRYAIEGGTQRRTIWYVNASTNSSMAKLRSRGALSPPNRYVMEKAQSAPIGITDHRIRLGS